MTSEWMGLHNPERHAPTSVTDMAWCNVCDGPCYSPEACCCCLAAEVKRLERAEAAIARVRELHGRHDPNCPYGEDCAGAGLCLACREEYPCATIRALEGDNDVLH